MNRSIMFCASLAYFGSAYGAQKSPTAPRAEPPASTWGAIKLTSSGLARCSFWGSLYFVDALAFKWWKSRDTQYPHDLAWLRQQTAPHAAVQYTEYGPGTCGVRYYPADDHITRVMGSAVIETNLALQQSWQDTKRGMRGFPCCRRSYQK